MYLEEITHWTISVIILRTCHSTLYIIINVIMTNTNRLIENRYYSIELEKCTTPQCFGNMHGKRR